MTYSWRSTILNRTLLIIRLTLHLWSNHPNLRCLKERQRRASSFSGSHHGWSTSSSPNIIDSTMHDVNIGETKCETSVLALSLFYDQVNITPLIKVFRSKIFGRAPKKSFFLQRITSRSIDTEPTEHCWHYKCMMSISKRQSVKLQF